MNKRGLIIILAILLYFPVFAHAGIVNLQVHHNTKPGEFSSPKGIFNSSLNSDSHGEFMAKRIFSERTIFKNTHSGELKVSVGTFSSTSSEFSSSNPIFKSSGSELSCDSLISKTEGPRLAKGPFKSPDQGVFKFSLPK